MSITTLLELSNAIAIGHKVDIVKFRRTASTLPSMSLWLSQGYPVEGPSPGSLTGTIYDATSPYGPSLPPPTGGQYYLASANIAWANPAGIANIILFDKLWGNSEMNGTVTSDTTLGTCPDLTRPDANGEDTELWIQVWSALGATDRTLSVVYTNSVGQTGKIATFTTGITPAVAYSAKMKLQDGDTGVRKCTSYYWSGSTGTAGNFGLVIQRRIAELGITGDPDRSYFIGSSEKLGNGCQYRTEYIWSNLGLPTIYDAACIDLMWYGSTLNDSGGPPISLTLVLVPK